MHALDQSAVLSPSNIHPNQRTVSNENAIPHEESPYRFSSSVENDLLIADSNLSSGWASGSVQPSPVTHKPKGAEFQTEVGHSQFDNMPGANTDISVVGAFNPVEGHIIPVPTHGEIDEKLRISAEDREISKETSDFATKELSDASRDDNSDDVIIVTGADAAAHLLPLRDDGQPALSFRSIVLATVLSAFQAVMYQIYSFKPTSMGVIQGTFIVLIAYFLGKAWVNLLPRGDKFEARWRERGGQGTPPLWIRIISFFNYGPWNLKEHAICAITATSASNAAATITVFAAQDLFYGIPLSATTVILAVISIGLFGYGLCGIFRPIMVWHPESVYWSTLPTVKTLQGLHWQDLKHSKPLRYFWYAFGSMFAYEFLPAYIFPWLNSVSIPCLAAMHATGSKAAVLTNLFGGATNNEGLGLFSLSFDWQYITSFNTSLPLKMQLHTVAGYIVCFAAMLGIYYTNAWDSKAQPFMSTQLRSENGSRYPTSQVFSEGILNQTALEEYGTPSLTGSFAYAMFMANAAIGALIAHCFLFWGGDVVRAFKSARNGTYEDPHHAHMAKTYKEAPWWWYVAILVGSFVLGLVVVLKENITLPVWAYIVALLLGCFIAPLSNILYARYGNGIATNNLSKMLAGLMLPGRPVGNMLGYWCCCGRRSPHCRIPGSQIRGFDLTEVNMAQFIQYAGFIPYNQSQTCVIFSQVIAGVFTQLYLRNYRQISSRTIPT
ncbi:hypothetical protein EYC84_002213 [Monilinia fructicola]|uniref:OPT family small oligopeptide transporter n=1 Tax=Monilinia fructicola TaxID=38448 RepID=A0A5M9JMI1_MONFR|nr:hypothetical protein EYC84_002213 [Monilinia fructicola]